MLRPNRHWPGFRAGQHVERRGRDRRRPPSAHATASRRRRRRPRRRDHREAAARAARVSNWLHDQVAVGDVLDARARRPATFVLPKPLPETAADAVGRQRHHARDVDAARPAPPRPGARRRLRPRRAPPERRHLRRRARAHSPRPCRACALTTHFTAERGRFDADGARGARARLRRAPAPCSAARAAFMDDGPGTLGRATASPDRLACESLRWPASHASRAAGAPVQVRCARSERLLHADGASAAARRRRARRPRAAATAAAWASATPAAAVKRERHRREPAHRRVSSEPGERIQLCISAAPAPTSTLEL